ncbi:MAG: creatininase family protein [Planctomycetota bacterium]|nr:creatininase family protein [Planctomycetota bacterium]
MSTPWRRYEELRPDELQAIVSDSPVAIWPLGLLEHHGWHLPIGFDGIKAERLCIRLAEKTGGVLLPVMWWGGRGGHGDFHWTFYQSEEAYSAIVTDTVKKLIHFGFRSIVLMAGHYPWQGTLDRIMPPIKESNPDVLFLWGTELRIGGEAVKLAGDHAALEETSYGLNLFPEFVDMEAMHAGRGDEAWPRGVPANLDGRYPELQLDPNHPLFSQLGKDARDATGERVEAGLEALVTHLSKQISIHLGE